MRGIATTWRTERNFRIQTAIAIVTIVSGVAVQLSRIDWLLLLSTIMVVLSAELGNTAIERLADAVTEEHNAHVQRAKDIAAGMVLLVSFGAVAMAIGIFAHHLI